DVGVSKDVVERVLQVCLGAAPGGQGDTIQQLFLTLVVATRTPWYHRVDGVENPCLRWPSKHPASEYPGKGGDRLLGIGWDGLALDVELQSTVRVQFVDPNSEQL